MTNLSVPITDRTEWLETFVLFTFHKFITRDTVSDLFASRLSSQLVRLVFVKTLNCILLDSHGIRTSAYGHGGTDICHCTSLDTYA